jgi:hypothetical protein
VTAVAAVALYYIFFNEGFEQFRGGGAATGMSGEPYPSGPQDVNPGAGTPAPDPRQMTGLPGMLPTGGGAFHW